MAYRQEESRTATVLDPSFVEDLHRLPVEELRRRRDRAVAEREFLSYLRRLIQVRQDVLAAERDRRREGRDPPPVVERLKEALAEGGRAAPPRGEALRTPIGDRDAAEAERRVDAVLGPLAFATLESLDEDQLEEALELLDREERSVSAERAAVFRVHDRLQEELKRRYREDPSSIPREP